MKRAVCWNLWAGAVLCLFGVALVFAFETIEGRPMEPIGAWVLMLLLSGMMYPVSFVVTWVIDQRATWTFADIIGRLLVTALSPLVPWMVLAVFCAAFSVVCELLEDPRAVSYVIGLLLNR